MADPCIPHLPLDRVERVLASRREEAPVGVGLLGPILAVAPAPIVFTEETRARLAELEGRWSLSGGLVVGAPGIPLEARHVVVQPEQRFLAVSQDEAAVYSLSERYRPTSRK